MPLTAANLAGWAFESASADAITRHAIAELRSHLGQVPPTGVPGVVRLELTASRSASDGFQANVTAELVLLKAASPRGLLNAVYWLLERVGFAWVEPGDRGVCLRAGASLAEGAYAEEPSFGRRTLILGQDALQDDWRDWIEWASRNRLNDVFFHDTPPSVLDRAGVVRPELADEQSADGFGWMFERWDSDGPAIRDFARERGVRLQFGGHHLPALVPRSQFERHPEWFPLRNGVREPLYNLCV
jgi:hypothetical protein